MGIRVGGTISGGSPLVDAQLVGYVNTSLSFQASATASAGSTSNTAATYRYGIYLFYNLGYGAYASIKFFPNWALTPRNAFNPSKRYTIYENTGSFNGPTKRSIDTSLTVSAPRFPRRGLISDWHGAELTSIDQLSRNLGNDEVADSWQHNKSSAINSQFLLGKRADISSTDSQMSDFTSQLTCPPGDSAQVRLPDFRLKSIKVCFYWLILILE